MSIVFGPLRQAGFVVNDLARSMRYWSEVFGIGPFYVLPELRFRDFHYRGRPSPSPTVSLAFAQSGGLQIELIQQHDETPSGYREFLSAGREGMQHLSSWFADRASYDAAHAGMLARGMVPVHEVISASRGPRFAYFETGRADAPLIEISEALLPETRSVPEIVAAAAADWDGATPIRYFTPAA